MAKAMELVELVYKATDLSPREDLYGLTSQLRRSAVSVSLNIAEGQGRWSRREFRRFLSMAHGSLREVETPISIAERLSYLSRRPSSEMLSLVSEVGRLVNGLANSLARQELEPDP